MKNTVIGKKAFIGKNVHIGNFTTIENDVVIGDNTWIGNNVNILDGAKIGENCQIHSGAVLSGIPQDLKYNGEDTTLEIGNNNIIREFVTINKGTISKHKTIIGDNNLVMANAHIGHDCVIGDNTIIGFSVGMAGEVIVGNWINISGLTAIHQFSVIGEHSMISGISRVVKDVPPYVMAAREPLSYVGLNTIGLKRRKFESEKINELKEIYRIIFQENRNTTLALGLIENNFKPTKERDIIIQFIKQSTRGIIKGRDE
ncbi:acyl-ACP--UDP-N-acetylglucosamine O-acyltransferase [Solitalea canadensis]|uniref:Acyl-(Acyl-carrier-protein)--UDP-N-acetylglucosamine O-acyltransferase n=1 Tax=Solitalea canadensis (strain ATCC 29591 / DSM 3403 / JCM 21819 / LMG 8368 / NBRC 15130 / NCIMB 12057 / USAM 9D) TaxID=929556 RepID=H8KTP0_SOLCM|nr:acyl-ACP--UDP-N-acetylglucosamine O-acyltransferase [Solitalea canadensis]AFD06615.1 acyl-(acyl-carrier-protein)--UDP-N-acetylglucosamine O-acyltransferase [Solitalea canadensis DSM 3403]